jgi:RNA polymerase sigma-70 factor (ECF subfamily)
MNPPLPEDLARRFESEILPHLDLLWRMGLSLTRDPNTAEDLVQDALLRAMRGLDGLKDNSRLRSWLARVVHTTWLDQLRREARRPLGVWEEGFEETLPDGEIGDPASFEPEILRQAFDDEWEEALNELPPQWKAALLLVDAEGFSYEEAAATFEVPVGTIRSRLYRARRRLASFLQSQDRNSRGGRG